MSEGAGELRFVESMTIAIHVDAGDLPDRCGLETTAKLQTGDLIPGVMEQMAATHGPECLQMCVVLPYCPENLSPAADAPLEAAALGLRFARASFGLDSSR